MILAKIYLQVFFALAFSSSGYSQAMRLKVGDFFPSYSLETISKYPFKETELSGKVIVYDVSGSWAHGASEALPYYTKLLKKYKKKGLRVVAINIDNDIDKALRHIKGITNEFPVLYDLEMKFIKKLNPEGFPMVYVVSRKGVVKDVIRDYCENEFDQLEKRIVKVLNEN